MLPQGEGLRHGSPVGEEPSGLHGFAAGHPDDFAMGKLSAQFAALKTAK